MDSTTRPPFNPDPQMMRQVGYNLIDRIVDHLTTLSDQPVARRGTHVEYAEALDEPLNEEGRGLGECLDFFFERAAPGMTRVNHPRFHAYIPCPSSFAGAIGQMLASGVNPFMGSWLGGATICELELITLRWIAELLGFDPKAAGIFTSGGSTANLIGLAAARAWAGGDILRSGVIYVSSEGHASVNKAAAILGFEQEAIRVIEVDSDFCIRTDLLAHAIDEDRQQGRRPFFISANAGATNTGVIDPLPEVADLCEAKSIWFHVDGAYGGFAAMTETGKTALRGMDRADSLTLDPHKWLYCPMGIGCAFVRDQRHMERAFSTHGDYLKDLPKDEVNFLDRGPELSRPARVLAVWMVLRSAGRLGLTRQIDEDLKLAQVAADLLREGERFEVFGPNLSVINFRHRVRDGETEKEASARDNQLMEATLDSGELMLSTTLIDNRCMLRMVVMNHLTTMEDIQRSVRAIHKLSEA